MRFNPWLIWFSLLSAAALVPHRVAAAPPSGEPPPSVTVAPRVAGRGVSASATIRIQAGRRAVWGVLTSCRDAVLIVPHLRRCEVEQTAPDRSWQRIRQVVGYPWYLPRASYVVTATYRPFERIGFDEVAGDFKLLRGSWRLRRDGGATIADYEFDVVPAFWMPAWFIRLELKSDLPKMLRALRARAECRAGSPGSRNSRAAVSYAAGVKSHGIESWCARSSTSASSNASRG